MLLILSVLVSLARVTPLVFRPVVILLTFDIAPLTGGSVLGRQHPLDVVIKLFTSDQEWKAFGRALIAVSHFGNGLLTKISSVLGVIDEGLQ